MTYSLQRLLIILGLVFIPFYEIFLHILPFVRNVATDTRVTKEIISLVFAISIGLLAVFQGTIKPFKNKWFLIIPVYLLFNLIIAPHVDMFINGIESGDFYFWKPFAEVLCFTLMIIAVASMEIDFQEILKVMVICGAVMAGYVILQRLGFDQFFVMRPLSHDMITDTNSIGGNLGQSTIVASFIVMMVPLAFYLRRYFMAILMIIGILITQSDMAFIALISIGIFSIMYFNKILIPYIIGAVLILIIGMGFLFIKNPEFNTKILSHMSGRSTAFQQIYTDIREGAIEGANDYSFTGVGFGRFPFIFPDRHKSSFQQAHCDPAEFAYNCGFAGLGLLLGGIYFMTRIALVNISPICFSILLSFIAIFICSLGSFPFQLGAHQFYSAVIVGLLHNRGVLNA